MSVHRRPAYGCTPPRPAGHRRRRRRRRLRRRRPHRGAALRRPARPRYRRRHQGPCSTTAPRAGRRAASPRRSARATPPSSTSTTPSSPARACATRRPCGSWSPRAPTPCARLIATGARLRHATDDGELAAHPRGRPPPAPHRARGRRRHRRRDLRGRWSRRYARGGDRGHRERARARPAQGRRRPHRRASPCTSWARASATASAPSRARAVVLATGGMGQVFSATTNPAGLHRRRRGARAARRAPRSRDLEFVQFHPTVLWLGADAEGQQPLVSEAVRGEGAHLVDADGVRFMVGQHELAELAPRDIVAKGIMRRMRETGADAHVPRRPALRRRDVGARASRRSCAACRAARHRPGRPSRSRSPRPRTTPPAASAPTCTAAPPCPGLYACGEVACTGVHGANRLASNSLLEGLVFAERIAADIQPSGGRATGAGPGEPVAGVRPPATAAAGPAACAAEIQRIMTRGRGRAAQRAESLEPRPPRRCATPAWTPGRRPSRASRRGRPPTCSPSPACSWRPPRRPRGDPRLPLARGPPRARRRDWRGHLVVDPDRTDGTCTMTLRVRTRTTADAARDLEPTDLDAPAGLDPADGRRGLDPTGALARGPGGRPATSRSLATILGRRRRGTRRRGGPRATGVVAGLRGRRGGRSSRARTPRRRAAASRTATGSTPGRSAADRRPARPATC